MPLYELDGKRPQVDARGAWVSPTSDLIGDVLLHEDASVWFRAVVRADNTPIVIGRRSNIQDGAVLHSDPGSPLTIGEDVTVGHQAVLHGCTIEDGVLIGMGAKVLNNAVIGRGSIVGAGALVLEGKTFPPGSLIVGSPAVRKNVTDLDTLPQLLASAQVYVSKAQAYEAALTRIDEPSERRP